MRERKIIKRKKERKKERKDFQRKKEIKKGNI